MNPLLLEILKGAIVGATIGWATNQLAVWMLFHPKREVRLFGLRIPLTPGLVVRNQERLADSIGRAVASDLLDPDTLVRHLEGVRLREPIAAALDDERALLLTNEQTVLEFAGPAHRAPLLALRRTIAERMTDFTGNAARSIAAGEMESAQWMRESLGELLDRPLGEFLTLEDRAALAQWASGQLRAILTREQTGEIIRSELREAITRFPETKSFHTFHQMVGEYLTGRIPAAGYALQETLAEYVGEDEFGAVVRERVANRLHDIIASRLPRFASYVTKGLVKRLLAQRWPEVTEELQDTVRGPELERFIMGQLDDAASSVLEAIVEAIQDEETLDQLASWAEQEIQEALPKLAEGESTQAALAGAIDSLCAQTPRQLMARLHGGESETGRGPAARLADGLSRWLETDAGRRTGIQAAEAFLDRLFFRQQTARIAKLIPEEEWESARTSISEAIEERTLKALPKILSERLDLQDVVSAKIREFDTDTIEETIVRVSGRELKGIVRLGGLIGLAVGAAAAALNALWPVMMAAGG